MPSGYGSLGPRCKIDIVFPNGKSLASSIVTAWLVDLRPSRDMLDRIGLPTELFLVIIIVGWEGCVIF